MNCLQRYFAFVSVAGRTFSGSSVPLAKDYYKYAAVHDIFTTVFDMFGIFHVLIFAIFDESFLMQLV